MKLQDGRYARLEKSPKPSDETLWVKAYGKEGDRTEMTHVAYHEVVKVVRY